MARIAGSDGAQTAEAIKHAGLQLIYEHGFAGFGLRELAQRVGVRPASLYNYFSSKQDLLFGLIGDHMRALIASTEAVLADCRGNALDRLVVFCAHHTEYHIDRRLEVFVANFELRSLSEGNRGIVLSQRHHYEAILIGILDDGRAAGLIGADNTHVAAYATLAMLTGACTWYRPNGRLTREEVSDLHVRMALDGCLQRAPAWPPKIAAPPVAVTPVKSIRRRTAVSAP